MARAENTGNPTAIESGFRIAVLVPCHNQGRRIAGIVRGFAEALPSAVVYVFDNNSTDDTASAAARAGARVYREVRQGKGNVIRRMFADVDADIYVLADGGGSYDPADAPSLVNALITERVDMVVGTRSEAGRGPRQQVLGERVFDWLYRRSFAGPSTDIVSCYRAFSRRFVKSFPAISTGFDVEIELSMHASQLMIPVAEIELDGGTAPRPGAPPQGIRHGLHPLGMTAMLLKESHPFLFFAAFAVVFWVIGLTLMIPILVTRMEGVAVSSLSTALFGTSMFIAGFIAAGCGLILDALGRSRVEQKRVLFLTVPGLGAQ